MNVTAKDNALISETAYSWRYPLPFAFRQREYSFVPRLPRLVGQVRHSELGGGNSCPSHECDSLPAASKG